MISELILLCLLSGQPTDSRPMLPVTDRKTLIFEGHVRFDPEYGFANTLSPVPRPLFNGDGFCWEAVRGYSMRVIYEEGIFDFPPLKGEDETPAAHTAMQDYQTRRKEYPRFFYLPHDDFNPNSAF